MAKIKVQINNQEGNDDPDLVAKVDQMMEPPRKTEADSAPVFDDQPTEINNDQDTGTPPPLDIFSDLKTAPPLMEPKSTKTKTAAKKKKSPDPGGSEVLEEAAMPSEAPPPPNEYDDQKTEEAIEDIVSHESDQALEADDQISDQAEFENQADEDKGHPWFWTLVALISLVAIAMAVFLIDPSLHNPLSKLHWSSIKRHL